MLYEPPAMPIQHFKDGRCARLLQGEDPGRGFPTDLKRRTSNKLRLLDEAQGLDDLRDPPGNHLEALSGDRAGQHSIRVNRQFRICFRWTAEGPTDVEFVDYH